MEYYSATKGNTFRSVLMKWMNLEPILLHRVTRPCLFTEGEGQILYINAYIQNLESYYRLL